MAYIVETVTALVTVAGIVLAIGAGYLAIRSLYRLGRRARADGPDQDALKNRIDRLTNRIL